jgi:hypothetical protein
VHGGQLVKELRVHELQTRLKEFSANDKGQHATQNQHRERKEQVKCADVFVIGCKNPSAPSMRSPVVIIVMISSHGFMWV